MTVAELRESFRIASRKPQDIERWALEHVPEILDRLEELEKLRDSWLSSDTHIETERTLLRKQKRECDCGED